MFLQLGMGVIGTKFRDCRSVGSKASKQAYLDRHVIRGLLPIHLQDAHL